MKMDPNLIMPLQEKIARGNQGAFTVLYRLFFLRLFNFVMLYVHQKETAEELVNDVMVKLWQKQELINEIRNLETYLFIACRNRSLNYLSQFSTYRVTLEPETGGVEVVNTNDPALMLEWKEMYHRLNKAIDELPDQCRTVFKLIKEEGFRYKQVAEILGISPRTVETQLFRAMKKLNGAVDAFRKQSRDGQSFP